MKRALLVVAVSDAHKDQDPKTQELILRDQSERLGFVVVHVLVLKMSRYRAKSAARAEALILEAVREHRAQVLATIAIDRILRTGIAQTLQFIDVLEGHFGCSLYSHREPEISTATASPEMRSFLVAFRAWAANIESKRRGDRVRDKVQARRAQAANLGQRVRWGRGHLVTAADQDRLAKLELTKPGISLRAAARELGLPWTTVRRMRLLGQTTPPNWAGDSSEKAAGGPKVPLEQPGGDSDG